MLNFLLLMLSKVTFGVKDPIYVYNLLVKFFGVINCDERVLSEIFCSIYKKKKFIYIERRNGKIKYKVLSIQYL